jgi:two-component system chemotaxis response regulator CheY
MGEGAITVVLIDDDEDIVALERDLLERDGRFVIVGEGGDGASAVRLARTTHPDAIVLDVLMPRMDGWEALPLIKRVSPDTQVVVISALGTDSELNDRAVWLGAATYLDKLEISSMPAVLANACAS